MKTLTTIACAIALLSLLTGAFYIAALNAELYYRALDDIHEIRIDVRAIREAAPPEKIKFRGGRSKLETPEKSFTYEV